jgi:hypothetical protein
MRSGPSPAPALLLTVCFRDFRYFLDDRLAADRRSLAGYFVEDCLADRLAAGRHGLVGHHINHFLCVLQKFFVMIFI